MPLEATTGTHKSGPTVTVEHLRDLATIVRGSLFRDADMLVLSDEGLVRVPMAMVEATLARRNQFVHQVVYARSAFADDGVLTGAHPRCADGTDLDARLELIADDLNRAPGLGREA